MNALVKFISAIVEGGKRILTLNAWGGYDPRTADECAPYGTDSSPAKDIQAIYSDTTSINSKVVIGYVNIQQKAQPGEHRTYSTNATGVFKFNIWLRADGTVLIGDSNSPADYTNFLVKFNELKTGFDALKSQVNAFVTAYNTHIHVAVDSVTLVPVTVSPTVLTATPATASIDSSKATKIKTN